ncbi:MAG: hypothetical protein ACOY93_18945, partial [Bacillota bacterium]
MGVKINQAYEVNLNVDILPAGKIPPAVKLNCQPRQGAERVTKDPLELPESTRTWVLEMNQVVTAWLSKDRKNQLLFLADPVGALQKAGIRLDRARLKELARLRESLGTAQAVLPGLQIRSVRTAAVKPDGGG